MAFDVTEWINSKLGSALDEKAIKSIKDFSLVWNIFEDRACDNDASLSVLEKYVDKNRINLKFTFLNLSKSDNPAFVESTLLAESPSLRDKALTSLIIIS